ncbi:hypothetical protein PC116_g24370 [Phytophthora cactorum]|nr:hypothetical protein PC116_g24370 [Phytophthora cactorum]
MMVSHKRKHDDHLNAPRVQRQCRRMALDIPALLDTTRLPQ